MPQRVVSEARAAEAASGHLGRNWKGIQVQLGSWAAMTDYWPVALGFKAAMTRRIADVLVGGDD